MSTFREELLYPITGEQADELIDRIRETKDANAYLEIKYIVTYHEPATARLIGNFIREATGNHEDEWGS